MKKILFVVLFASSASLAGEIGSSPVDWEKAERICEGVRFVKRDYAEPRLMKTYLMRIDLKTSGLRFTGTPRAKGWGNPMPDYPKGIIRTERETTAEFMTRERARGRDIIVAFNSDGWTPWCPPWNHRYGDPEGLLISDGVVVSDWHRKRNALFVAWDDGRCELTPNIPTNLYCRAQVAHHGVEIIMTNGVHCSKHGREQLHPRTAYGLSADGRFMFVLAVDGRQPGWSLGADYRDLSGMLRDAGASEAINMDGGGSTTMVYWDGTKPVAVNRHDPNRSHWRRNGANLGIYIEWK